MPVMLKALAMAGASISLASAAPLAPNSTLYSDGTPPLRYQGEGAAVVIMVDPANIDALCGKAPDGYRKVACMGEKDGAAIIVVPNPCDFDAERFAHILCYEKGHSLGWPGTHGD